MNVTATLDISGGSDFVEYTDNSYSSTAFGLNAYSTDSTYLILEDIQTNDFAVDSNQGFAIYMKYKLRDEQVQNVFDHYAVQTPIYQVTSSVDVVYTNTTNIQFSIFTLGDTNVSYSLTNATSIDFNGPSFSGTLTDVYTVLDYDLSITYNSASNVSLTVGTTTKTIPIVKTYILKVVNNVYGVPVFAMSTNGGLTYTNNERESFSTGDVLLFDVSDTSNTGYVLKFGPNIDDSSTAIEASPLITRTNTPGTLNATVKLDLREYSGSTLYYFETSNPEMGYIDHTINLVSLTFDVSGGTDIVHYDDSIYGATAHGFNIVETDDNTFLHLKNSLNSLLSTSDFAVDSSKGFTFYMKYKIRDEPAESVFDHYDVHSILPILSASHEGLPATYNFIFNVTVSNNKFFLNGVETPEIVFEAGKAYAFAQTDPTNEGFPLVIGKIPDSAAEIVSSGFVQISVPGQSDAFCVLTLPSDFNGNLFYYTLNAINMGNPLVYDFLYYMRVVTNEVGNTVYAISTSSPDGPYYNQDNITFTRPNSYLFDISHSSMDNYQLAFGTQVDNNNTIYNNVTYSTTNVYLDLRNYIGGALYYFNSLLPKMGYFAPPTNVLSQNTYTVTVSNGVFLLNDIERLDINFTPGVSYLFYQVDISNAGHQILFGRLPDDTANIVGDGITIVGTAGQPNAYTLVELPDTFNDALFYFSVSQSNMGNQISPDVIHYVKIVENVLGQNVYAIASAEDGIYYNQPDISFVSPNKYILYVEHSTNDGYQIAFGTTVDDSSTIYSGTTYDKIAEGTTGSFVYLDLRDDPVGQPLYMFDTSYAGMGYVHVPTTDNVFSVSMSTDQNHIFIDNILHPDIIFTAGQTYVFTQDGSSNSNYEIVFGETKHKRPLFTESNRSIVGTLGRPGAYTAITMPSDFYDRSLFYFTKSYVSDILYQVKVETNALNEPLFSFSQTGRYIQQPNITFTAPNQYYFDMSDVSNNGYVLQFGTTTDLQSSVNESVVFRSLIVPGQPGSFIFLDLSGYTGAELKYFEQTTAKMGYIPPPVILDSNSFTVTISDETLLLDKSFTGFQASQIYLFDQSHPSNDGFGQIVFGTTEGSPILYTTGVSLKGTPGLTGACSMIEIPADFTGSLFFYSLATYTRDIKYYVDIVTVDGNANYGFATTQDGSYNTNVSDLLSTYNKYYFNTEALVDTSYNIVFGTIIDSISSVPSVVQGFNTFSYIDISTYSGSSLFYFDETISNMSETTSTVLSKLDNPSQAILNAPVPTQRSYTKNVVSAYIQKKLVSEKPIELTPKQLVGFTVHERVKSIMIADTTNTFAKQDLLDKAIYTTLGTLNETITVPTRSGSVTVKNIGDDQFEVRRTDTDTILTTASAGEDYTIDFLKLEFGTLYAELDLTVICFKRDSKILCMCDETYEDKYIPVQHLKRGTLVKTYKHGYVPVHSIGYSSIYNSGDTERKKDRLYKCESSEYPELFEPLVVTGCHSILKDTIDNRTEHILRRENHGKLYCTDNKYRIMTYLDKKSKPYRKKGTFEIWHFALEHSDYYMNYGVYANGLLVETASKRMMTEIADMVYTG